MINDLIFEELSEKTKSRLKKLAIAGGMALAGGAGIAGTIAARKHLDKRNELAEKKDRRANILSGMVTTASGAYRPAKYTAKISKSAGKYVPDKYKKALHITGGVAGGLSGAGKGLGQSIANRMIAKVGSRLIHGKDTIWNRKAKADTRRKITVGLNTAATGHNLLKPETKYEKAVNKYSHNIDNFSIKDMAKHYITNTLRKSMGYKPHEY